MKHVLNVKLSFEEALEKIKVNPDISGIIDGDNPEVVIRVIDGTICVNDVKTDLTIKTILEDNWFIVD